MPKTITTGFLNEKINGIAINSALECHSSNYTNMNGRNVMFIVVHYTGNEKDLAKNNANYFTGANRDASAHFFVDDTSIYQSVELKDVAWHCGTRGTYYHPSCRNNNAIGIEMCCTVGNYKISEKTKKNTAYLVANLCKKLGITADKVDTYLLRHYDVTHKNCPAQMSGAKNGEWTEFKKTVKNIMKKESTPILETTGFKKYDKTTGVLAMKSLLIIAKKLNIITQPVDNNTVFGDGTEKAVNQVLKKLGYKQNGIAGERFIKSLTELIEKEYA